LETGEQSKRIIADEEFVQEFAPLAKRTDLAGEKELADDDLAAAARLTAIGRVRVSPADVLVVVGPRRLGGGSVAGVNVDVEEGAGMSVAAAGSPLEADLVVGGGGGGGVRGGEALVDLLAAVGAIDCRH